MSATRKNTNINLKSTLLIPGLILYYLMLMFPMVLELLYIKAMLFAFVLFIITIKAIKRREPFLHPVIVHWTCFLLSLSILFVLNGAFSGAMGALKQAQIYVLWPIIYIVIVAGATNLKTIKWLEWVIILAAITISVYGLNFVLAFLKVVPEFGYLRYLNNLTFSSYDAGISLSEGYTRITIPGMNSLPFLIPYIMGLLLTYNHRLHRNKKSIIFISIAFFLVISFALLSGRRGLWIVSALSPIFIIILKSYAPGSHKLNQLKLLSILILFILIICGGTILISQYSTNINVAGLFDYFSGGFGFGAYYDQSAFARNEQFFALMEGWENNLIIGAGLGSYTQSCIRSVERPWSYELYYIALLYQTGIIGLMAYGWGILWIFYMGINIIKKGGALGQMIIPSLAGLFGILISSATNPYIDRFDGLWAIFFPLILINYWLLYCSNANNHNYSGHKK